MRFIASGDGKNEVNRLIVTASKVVRRRTCPESVRHFVHAGHYKIIASC
jgi:hypothetical protein